MKNILSRGKLHYSDSIPSRMENYPSYHTWEWEQRANTGLLFDISLEQWLNPYQKNQTKILYLKKYKILTSLID